MVEQSLLSGKPKVVSGEKKVVPIGRHFADVWQTDNLDGQTFILVAWDEIGYSTATLVMSTEDEEERWRWRGPSSDWLRHLGKRRG